MERELSFQYDGLFEIDQYGEGSMMFSFASEIRGYPPSVSYVSTEEVYTRLETPCELRCFGC